MDALVYEVLTSMPNQKFDAIAVSMIDFKQMRAKSFEYTKSMTTPSFNPQLYFDVASLTKPFTLATSYFKHPHLFDERLKWLLNHRAGLPAWGRLAKRTWREQILSYPIVESPTLYSDFSALRLMLELEKRSEKNLSELCSPWGTEKYAFFWKKIADKSLCPSTGWRAGRKVQGEVNDDNAYVIDEFCSHAGLFAKVDDCALGIINWWQEGFFRLVQEELKKTNKAERFVMGLDRVTNPEESLASAAASLNTVGHLGFTGTSFWVDLEKELGLVIFTNATQQYCYHRQFLNELRKHLASIVFSSKVRL